MLACLSGPFRWEYLAGKSAPVLGLVLFSKTNIASQCQSKNPRRSDSRYARTVLTWLGNLASKDAAVIKSNRVSNPPCEADKSALRPFSLPLAFWEFCEVEE